MKFLIFLMCEGLGFVSIIYTKWLVDSIGRSQFFEEKLGSGGTYTFWKLLGVASIIFGFFYLFS
ncbi:MAG: hypothetical protein WC536_03140 [Patescibacteria group bacterium]